MNASFDDFLLSISLHRPPYHDETAWLAGIVDMARRARADGSGPVFKTFDDLFRVGRLNRRHWHAQWIWQAYVDQQARQRREAARNQQRRGARKRAVAVVKLAHKPVLKLPKRKQSS